MSAQHPLPIADFDPRAFEALVQSRRDAAATPRHRRILDNLLQHSRNENDGNLAALSAILSKKSQSYKTFGHDDYPQPSSYDETITFYEMMFASCTYVHHVEADHVAVDDDSVAVDGVMHLIYPAAVAALVFDTGGSDAPAFLASLRMAIVFLFDDEGLSAGEHVYSPTEPTITPIAEDELPELYVAALARSGQSVGE